MRLIASDCHEPVNIGSTRAITMREFVDRAARAVDIDPSMLTVTPTKDRPTGVASRNSDNTFVQEALGGWSPSTPLESGMQITGRWIEQQMSWQQSRVLQLTSDADVVFAILLPITSRTGIGQRSTTCLDSLASFAASLRESISHSASSPQCCTRIYLAVDDDDEILCNPANPAAKVLHNAGFTDVVTLTCHLPPGRVCSLWRECARRAWEDRCDYYVLMGDDVVLPAEAKGWQAIAHDTFGTLAKKRGLPFGFGFVPDIFVNQDGDPYLFQLYRRFGCSVMMTPTIHNTLGGSDDARYQKVHAKDWTFGTLDEGTHKLESFFGENITSKSRKLTVDVIIPCYRVNMSYLDKFLQLPAPNQAHIMFIIIVDDPASPNISELQKKYGHRWDVRIRVNKKNLGASASRNRGLLESAAEWVLFLDDDVVPDDDILSQLVNYIQSNPDAAGLVGNSKFPVADSIFTTALHLAGVTYFWDIAEKIDEDVRWGVTANLAASRRRQDGVVFNLSFPKTGGGEDIDYCRKKREFSISRGGTGFMAAPKAVVTHPYWNGGKRSYWRLYMWSKGDGALIKLYPRHVSMAGISMTAPVYRGLWSLASVILANVIHDAYRHLIRHPERCQSIKTTIHGISWILAVLESTFVRIASEVGRTVGILERHELSYILHRFDWFAGHPKFGEGPKREERRNSMERCGLCLLIFALGCFCFA
ncbi:nucleotide-diphospho-sugar transferase [Irpex lacteus]|nr:nucleotide-diphospho-sugar transferase [Irpex lacteus]